MTKVIWMPDLFAKTAALFHSLLKNHPFNNGNKRTAVVMLIDTLCHNGLMPGSMVDNAMAYDVTVRVAASGADAQATDKTIEQLRRCLAPFDRCGYAPARKYGGDPAAYARITGVG